MKRSRKLGVLLVVFVLACIATFALSHYEQKQEQIKTSDEVILEIPRDSVTALSWAYTEEGSLAFHKDENGWHYDADDAFPVSEEKVEDILSHFEAFGVSFIIENVEDYSQYGLDKPECTLHIATQDAAYDIRLGDFSKMDQQRYVDIGDGNVYLVKEDPEDYVSAQLSSMILDDDIPGFEKVVDIRFTGKENYIVERLEGTDYSYSDRDVYFTQQNGKYLPLDTSAVTRYLNTITSLDLLTYVTYNATEEELVSYGLDEPELSVTVNYTYTDEASEDATQIAGTCVIHISRNPAERKAAEEAEAKGENAEAVSMYVRVGDSQIVYELDSVDYGILSAASYDDLRHQEIFWGDFAEVSQIDIALEGDTHTLVAEAAGGADDGRVWRYLTTDTAGEVETAAAEEAEASQPEETEDDALDLSDFQDALNAISATGFTSEKPTAKEEIRLTLHLDNERFPKTEIILYRYDGTSCLAVIDGQSVSFVPRASVMELVESVQAIVLNYTDIQ